MEVIVAGGAALFSNLGPGTFFKVLQAPPVFGLCVTDGQKNAALMFAPNRHGHLPTLAVGGLPQDSLIELGKAHVRLDINAAISTVHAVPAVGEVIDAGGRFFIRASNPTGGQAVFDLETGNMATLPTSGAAISYRRWEIGHVIDDSFQRLFSHSVP